MSEFSISLEQDGDASIARVHGEVDMDTSPRLRDQLQGAMRGPGRLVVDLSAREVAQLLQSPLLGDRDLDGRARLERRLRQMPDRPWAPSMVTTALRGAGESTDGSDWLRRLAAFSKLRRDDAGG